MRAQSGTTKRVERTDEFICIRCGSVRGEGSRRRGNCCWDCHKSNSRAWYVANSKQAMASSTKWRMKHPERRKEIGREWWVRIRRDVIDGYGGRCECCSEDELAFLCIDHINGSGNGDRQVNGRTTLYVRLRTQNFPVGFRVLCHNCNWGEWRGRCPHVVPERTEMTKLKLETFSRYGSSCLCCQIDIPLFLTIDHIAGDGAEQRRITGCRTGDKFYRWLRSQNWPEGFQTLCRNCNWAKAHGGCPHEVKI